MVQTARDIMTAGAECIDESQPLLEAARRMRDLDIGALPVCGSDGRLTGLITDRDIVVRCLAAGGDPATVTAGELADGDPVTIGADDPLEDVLAAMGEYQVRRLPVLDGDRLVGIISEADIARHSPGSDVGETIEAVTND